VDSPDIHPDIAEPYARKVARLTEFLRHPDDGNEAADAIRRLIENTTRMSRRADTLRISQPHDSRRPVNHSDSLPRNVIG
jgi:hypothetical protein